MKKILISFIGGRVLPNIQVALSETHDDLYVIASKDSMHSGGSYKKFINALPAHLKHAHHYSVEPYNINDSLAVCREIASNHSQDEFCINIASEPKPMSLGAYKFYQEMMQKNIPIKMLYSSRDGIVDVSDKDVRPKYFKISIQDYFHVYGWEVRLKQYPEQNRIAAAKMFVDMLPESHALLKKMKDNDRGKGKKTINIKGKFSDNELSIIKKLYDFGLLSNIQTNKKNISYTIEDQEKWEFLKGEWLEQYIYIVAKDIKNDKGERLFDECAWNVEDIYGNGEIDFVGILNGQLLVASCKTEKKIKAENFNEISTRGDQLGRGMCTKFLVTSTTPNDQQRTDAERWAKDREIIFVGGDKLHEIGSILKKEAENSTYQRI